MSTAAHRSWQCKKKQRGLRHTEVVSKLKCLSYDMAVKIKNNQCITAPLCLGCVFLRLPSLVCQDQRATSYKDRPPGLFASLHSCCPFMEAINSVFYLLAVNTPQMVLRSAYPKISSLCSKYILSPEVSSGENARIFHSFLCSLSPKQLHR